MSILTPLLACTVCYGDPASPLSKGAVAGVIVLGVAIVGVLGSFIGLFLYWMKRARALEAALAASGPGSASNLAPPPAGSLPLSAPASTPASPLTLH